MSFQTVLAIRCLSRVRSVRLDVYARDAVEVDFDIEMQNEDEKNLPKRSRYYQAQMIMWKNIVMYHSTYT
ncbi:MAG: PD-(D/E)XK nuclease family transposase [Lachnospiraceae bacterium]|nr:PD-(D/E)XK nuclease family transposase [Lachnospiraceae bacterium]MDY4838794.1 PD-(D/E)XK nuclease family transposase [Lachnospiraceae bacterium]